VAPARPPHNPLCPNALRPRPFPPPYLLIPQMSEYGRSCENRQSSPIHPYLLTSPLTGLSKYGQAAPASRSAEPSRTLQYVREGGTPALALAVASSSGETGRGMQEPPAGCEPAGGRGWTRERPDQRPHTERRGEKEYLRKRDACGYSPSSLRSAPTSRPYALRGDVLLGRSAASSSSGETGRGITGTSCGLRTRGRSGLDAGASGDLRPPQSVHGARLGRSSQRATSGSPTTSSFSGSHLNGRPTQ